MSDWPALDPAARHGIAGEVVAVLEPHTEADPAGLLVSFLAAAGNAAGPAPHAFADGNEHPARLNIVLVGETSRGRKGTAWANIERVMRLADPGWAEQRVMGGLGSGEGLIAAVADRDDDTPVDKRLLVLEPEFARVLAVAARDGSTLSAVIRQAWDTGMLRVMTRRDPLVASRAHVSLVGHVTLDELRRRLVEAETANGFANRFIYILVRRARLLPSGGALDSAELESLGQRVRTALEHFRRLGRFQRNAQGEALWTELYTRMADGPDGLLGAVTARPEAQLLRLSVAYAGLDGTRTITPTHLHAAWALWQYADASATHIFGRTLGDDQADRLLRALQDALPAGLDGTQQRDLFGRHLSARALNEIREYLHEKGLAESITTPTGGRPRIVTYATCDQSDRSDQEREAPHQLRPSDQSDLATKAEGLPWST